MHERMQHVLEVLTPDGSTPSAQLTDDQWCSVAETLGLAPRQLDSRIRELENQAFRLQRDMAAEMKWAKELNVLNQD